MNSTLSGILLSGGFDGFSQLTRQQAEVLFLRWFYVDWPDPLPRKYNHLRARERNAEIIRRSRLGESTAALAREFGVSERRIRCIVQRYG